MKRNGFTLVELLAVIVILAIIALIAVPVFLGIINNSKKSSDKEGVNLYTDTVEKAIQKKQMSDPNFQPDKCTIKTDGNLECFSGTTNLGTVKVSMKGTKPTSGTIYIDEDDITYENIVLNGKTYYEKETPSFSIGDTIKYKGADWYVIEDSPSSQDYVTLLKETVLTNTELGTYSWNERELANFSSSGSNIYETSEIKEFLDTYMTSKQMTDELKAVDLNGTSYKIRLIAADDLVNNLGYNEEKVLNNSNGNYESKYTKVDSPIWVYSGFGETQNSKICYWTMIPGAESSSYSPAKVWIVNPVNGGLQEGGVGEHNAVRPVINLLKSAIPAQS